MSMDVWNLLTLLLFLVFLQDSQGSISSPCAAHLRVKDIQGCLDAIRKRAEDPSIFWFGNGYSSACDGKDDNLADCYNSRKVEHDSLVSRLFFKAELDPDVLDRFLEVTYVTQPGSYRACENEFKYDMQREVKLDPMSMAMMTPYEVRAHPEVRWVADDNSSSLYTLLLYDVGYFSVKALYINIPGTNLTHGERVVQYEGPMNPTRNHNPYVFLLYRQAGVVSLDEQWRSILGKRDWDTELNKFVEHHQLTGPVALNWVLVHGDPYGAEAKRTTGAMNTCSHFVSEAFKKHDVKFLPNHFSSEPYKLSVYVNVTFEATPVVVNSCCSIHSYPALTFNLNPLGDAAVLPAHTRGDITRYVTLHMATAFPDTQRDFDNKTLTLLAADPDVPAQAFGNHRLPFAHWLITNIRGGDVASGDVVLSYIGPAPPDPKPHRYYFLLFLQKKKLDPGKMDFSAANCSWDFRGRCRFDVIDMIEKNDLTLVGVTWMFARFDEFVREVYVSAGMNPRCAACHGVPGYSDPCPPLVTSSALPVVARASGGFVLALWSGLYFCVLKCVLMMLVSVRELC